MELHVFLNWGLNRAHLIPAHPGEGKSSSMRDTTLVTSSLFRNIKEGVAVSCKRSPLDYLVTLFARTLPNRQPLCQVLQRVATQQSITHVIYSLYPCPILGQLKSDYISYAVLLIMFLLIMFLSNILLCTMFLFINYIPTPIGVYVPLLTSTWAFYSYVTVIYIWHCGPT